MLTFDLFIPVFRVSREEGAIVFTNRCKASLLVLEGVGVLSLIERIQITNKA